MKYIDFKDIREYLKDIQRLDKIGYGFHCEDQWYQDRYQDNLGGVAIFEADTMIAYAIVCGIKKPFYDALRNGVLTGDINVSKDMYTSLDSPYIYLASTVVIPEERGKGYCAEMTRRLMDKYYTPDKHMIVLACKETEGILKCLGFSINKHALQEEKYLILEKNKA